MRRGPLWLRVLAYPVHVFFTGLGYLEYCCLQLMSLRDVLVDDIMLKIHSPARMVVTSCLILPPELWYIIFEQCESRSALLACSLVCTAWASISRGQLRLKMSIHNRERVVQLGRLLRSPTQILTCTTHCVSFMGGDFGQYWRIVRLLHLHGTRLRGAIIVGDAHGTLPLLTYFPDIVDLTFKSLGDGGLGRFIAQVSRFRCLRSLCINVECRSGGSFRAPDHRDLLPMTRLSVIGRWPSDLFDWLQSSCRALEVLELCGDTGWGHELVSPEALLRANADTLRVLKWTVPATHIPLNLAITKNLRSLVIEIHHESTQCALQTLLSLRPLENLEVRVQVIHPVHFVFASNAIASTFSEMFGSKLGMKLVSNELLQLPLAQVLSLKYVVDD
ncbi:hypothetical protein CPB85DRAFT_1434747 [Mucidula mucida]|nr:hypothetical protein CPB85DRAFT_1434747 [Mucidula mucida]